MIKLTKDEFLKINKSTLSGKVLCFVTDTVWGVGVMVDENIKSGINKIYQMKKRDFNKPLAVLVDKIDEFIDHVIINQNAFSLFDKWPGALTLIFKKKDDFFNCVTNNDTIGIRIPNCTITLDILKHIGPCATTSVNITSEEPLNDPKKIEKYFSDFIDYLIIDEYYISTNSSTVVDVSCENIKILRVGDIKI